MPKSAGDATVRMQCSPITTYDLDQIRGFSGKVPLPAAAGLSGAGVVIESGGNLKEGDRVVLAGATGAWGQYAVSSASHFLRVPSHLPVEYAAMLLTGPIAAYRLLKASGLSKGDAAVLSGAGTPIGLAALQLAKAWGIHAVGIANGVPPLQVERLKQMGLTVVPDGAFDAAALFGSSRPKVALSLVGGAQSAYLAETLGDGGKIVTCPVASDEAHILPSPSVASKGLSLETLPSAKFWQPVAEEVVAELCDLIKENRLKAAAVVRHEFGNLLDAIEEARGGPFNVVLMHEGTEKTWSNKQHSSYMAIDEKLQGNWDAAAAVQDPYLRQGRDQPWEILAAAEDLPVPESLRAKLAAVTTAEELQNTLPHLTLAERQALGLPGTQALTLSAGDLKRLVAEFAA